MSKEKSVFIIPGLGREVVGERSSKLIPNISEPSQNYIKSNWYKSGLQPIFYKLDWHNGEFDEKLEDLLTAIDIELEEGKLVSLLGTSAGVSMAMNAFLERTEQIDSVVGISGRLRSGGWGPRSLDSRSLSSIAFKDSVHRFESREQELSEGDRAKVLIVRALIDELVPHNTAKLEGAYDYRLPVPEHGFSIFAGMTFMSKPVIEFLKSGKFRK